MEFTTQRMSAFNDAEENVPGPIRTEMFARSRGRSFSAAFTSGSITRRVSAAVRSEIQDHALYRVGIHESEKVANKYGKGPCNIVFASVVLKVNSLRIRQIFVPVVLVPTVPFAVEGRPEVQRVEHVDRLRIPFGRGLNSHGERTAAGLCQHERNTAIGVDGAQLSREFPPSLACQGSAAAATHRSRVKCKARVPSPVPQVSSIRSATREFPVCLHIPAPRCKCPRRLHTRQAKRAGDAVRVHRVGRRRFWCGRYWRLPPGASFSGKFRHR